MTKTTKNGTRIGFGIVYKRCIFLWIEIFDLNELRKAKLTHLQTDLKTYNDVLLIEPDTLNQKWSKREHYVLKMY